MALLSPKSDGSAFFDVTVAGHLAILPEQLQDFDDIADLADDAESELLNLYTAALGNPGSGNGYELLDAAGDGIGLYIYLIGYDPFTTDAEQNLADAIIRTVAKVMRWVFSQNKRDPALKSEFSSQGGSQTYRIDHEAPLPPNTIRRLKNFSSKPATWAL